MLHNRMNLLSKIIAVVLCCVFISSDVFASASTRNNGSFDVQKNSTLTWGVGDYLLDGCSHPSSFDNS
ncbi:MAG: hypothetical protein IJU89_03485, partial [Alphaproteobacteria bacterium]|nr:hypothetical protein [Alphaproteobacteria bacterium]